MRWLYAKLVHDGEGDGVNGDFRALAEFEVGSEREIRFEPGSAARRAFVHKVAGDMGLVSGSIGEGMERCVVVRRGDGGRDEQKEVSDGEESAKYSSGRNWGEHVCAW